MCLSRGSLCRGATPSPVVDPALFACVQHPVRSIVLPMHDDDTAVQITSAIKKALHKVLSEDSVWWQEDHLMHAPLWHATVQEVRACSAACRDVHCLEKAVSQHI